MPGAGKTRWSAFGVRFVRSRPGIDTKPLVTQNPVVPAPTGNLGFPMAQTELEPIELSANGFIKNDPRVFPEGELPASSPETGSPNSKADTITAKTQPR